MTEIQTPPDTTHGDLGDVENPYPAETLAITVDRIATFNRRFITHADESSHDHLANLSKWTVAQDG